MKNQTIRKTSSPRTPRVKDVGCWLLVSRLKRCARRPVREIPGRNDTGRPVSRVRIYDTGNVMWYMIVSLRTTRVVDTYGRRRREPGDTRTKQNATEQPVVARNPTKNSRRRRRRDGFSGFFEFPPTPRCPSRAGNNTRRGSRAYNVPTRFYNGDILSTRTACYLGRHDLPLISYARPYTHNIMPITIYHLNASSPNSSARLRRSPYNTI